ncbi:hypothetical protein GCM10010361_10300 [Streptomyces olivaceiscleroticus]|uniref:SMI1/KNR4 family protein n=2 Tax=Streptomyces olivaceiscleroticus TaxID=68245 RepID=A0ABN0ZHW9_9ACTN
MLPAMGLDLTLVAADWERLRETPVEDRIEALEDAIWPPDLDDTYYLTQGGDKGWIRPPGRDAEWCAEYRFFCTTGAYRWHSRAGDAWADLRPLADASLREAMDRFLNGLLRYEDPADDPTLTGAGGFFPAATDRRHRPTLLICPPDAAPARTRAWHQAAPRLEELREPFAAECAGWAGRPDTFEDFTALLREWGEVVTEATRRGWGLVGLP